MAKLPHRSFEIYESREEAVQVLTPKVRRAAMEATAPESWKFTHLEVSREAGVTHVRFKSADNLGDEAAAEFRQDFAQLADKLGKDSKVLVDFTGVASFGAPLIETLVHLNKMLRNKGSRFALCCLPATVDESFFVSGR